MNFEDKINDHHDVTKLMEEDIIKLGRIHFLVGTPPCNDLSITGKKRGLYGKDKYIYEQI